MNIERKHTQEQMNQNIDRNITLTEKPRIVYKIIGFLLVIVFLLPSCTDDETEDRKLTFVVTVDPEARENQDQIVLSWNKIADRNGQLDISKIYVKDLNNDELITPVFYDADHDQVPEYLLFNTRIHNADPLRPFELVTVNKKKHTIDFLKDSIRDVSPHKVTYLTPAPEFLLENDLNGKWAETIAESFMKTYPDPAKLEIFAPGAWTYTNGFFTNGLAYLYSFTKKQQYIEFAQRWLDYFLFEDGRINPKKYAKELFRLDDILPGRSLLYVYDLTNQPKYLAAANSLIDQLEHQPKTSEGGYWHKKVYDWQMWLDGVYMSDVFMLQYANDFDKPEYFNEAIHQIKLIYHHTHDSVTGLLYHGWDESKSKVWANEHSGTSPEFWGRGMGWYMMALVDALDYIPKEHPERQDVLNIVVDLSSAIHKYQDEQSGLWYQVVDKAHLEGNWPESSCTAMFAYAFLKAYKKGYLPAEFNTSALKAYQGLKENFIYFDDSGKLYLTGTVMVGTLNEKYSDGSFDYYVSVDRRVNDFKGISALLYLAIADEYLTKNEM